MVARTALLTVGRFPKALTLARALHRNRVRVVVADPLKRQLCSVSRAVAKNYRVTAPNEDVVAWEQEILEIIERERICERVREIGPYFEERLAPLADLPLVGDVRGRQSVE